MNLYPVKHKILLPYLIYHLHSLQKTLNQHQTKSNLNSLNANSDITSTSYTEIDDSIPKKTSSTDKDTSTGQNVGACNMLTKTNISLVNLYPVKHKILLPYLIYHLHSLQKTLNQHQTKSNLNSLNANSDITSTSYTEIDDSIPKKTSSTDKDTSTGQNVGACNMLTKTNMMPTQSVADVIEITTPNNDAMKVKLISLAAKVNLGKTKFGEKNV